MLKVALFVGGFPRLSETFVINQAAALVEAGFDLDILAFNREESGLVHPAVNQANLMERASFTSDNWAWQAAQHVRRPYRLRSALEQIGVRQSTQFTGGAYDIVLCHFGPEGQRALNLRSAGVLEGEIWTVFHGYDVSQTLKDRPDAYRELFAQGDRFLPVSSFWRDRLVARGCPSDRTLVHHMGVDTQSFAYRRPAPIANRPARLLSVCRLVEKKGLDDALRALADLAGRAPELSWTYTIVGEGPLEAELKALALNLDLDDRVTFAGSTSSDQVEIYLREADVFLLPSVTASDGDMEGIPVSLMEAMACGAPVASTLHSGIPELIEHGVSGLLSPERAPHALAQHLRRLMTDLDLRRRLADGARDKVAEDFDSTRLNRRLAQAMKGQGVAPPRPSLAALRAG